MIKPESGARPLTPYVPPREAKKIDTGPADPPHSVAANMAAERTLGGKVNTQDLAKDLNRKALDGDTSTPAVLTEVTKQLSVSDRQILALDAANDLGAAEREQLSTTGAGQSYQQQLYKLATDSAPANATRPEVSALLNTVPMDNAKSAAPTSTTTPMSTPSPASVAEAKAQPSTPATDAKSVDAAYESTLKSTKSTAQAAAAATAKLNEISSKHANDPQYVNQVLQAARPTLDKVSTVLGENATSKAHNSDKDRQAIDRVASDLSEVAKRGNNFTALSIGSSIASKLPNSDELHHVDDAFDKYISGGGDKKLRDIVAGLMEKSGRSDGAQALYDPKDNKSILDRVGDVIKDGAKAVAGAIGNVLGGIKDWAVDKATGAIHLVTEAGKFAVDFAKGTVDVVGDIANIKPKDIQNAINAAKEAGLKLGGQAVGWINDKLKEAVNDLVDTKKINNLGPGDSYTVDAELNISADLAVSAKASLTVSRNDDGTYTVAADLEGGLGVGIAEKTGAAGSASASAEAKLGGRVEFKFTNAVDAAEGARVLARTAAAGSIGVGPSALGIGDGLMPSKADFNFLKQHISAIELSAGAGVNGSAELGNGLGKELGLDDKTLGDKLGKQLFDKANTPSVSGSAGAGLNVESTYRIEFKDGKPTDLVRKQTITLDGNAAADLPKVRENLEKLGIKVPDLSASGSLSIEVESRIPIKGGALNTLGDLTKLALDPANLVDKGAKVENTVTIRAEGTVSGDKKGSVEWKITNLEVGEIPDVISNVLKGNYAAVADAVDVVQTIDTYDIDTKTPIDIPLGVGDAKGERVVEDRKSHDVKKVA